MSIVRRIAVHPATSRAHSAIVAAVESAGAVVVEPAAAEGLVWLDARQAAGLEDLMAEHLVVL